MVKSEAGAHLGLGIRVSSALSPSSRDGLPPQHHLYYSPPEHHPSPSPGGAGHKYHENGQDNFTDFVSLVCQDGPPGPSRSPKVPVSSYYAPGMYPPHPPMSRPAPLVRSSDPSSVS